MDVSETVTREIVASMTSRELEDLVVAHLSRALKVTVRREDVDFYSNGSSAVEARVKIQSTTGELLETDLPYLAGGPRDRLDRYTQVWLKTTMGVDSTPEQRRELVDRAFEIFSE